MGYSWGIIHGYSYVFCRYFLNHLLGIHVVFMWYSWGIHGYSYVFWGYSCAWGVPAAGDLGVFCPTGSTLYNIKWGSRAMAAWVQPPLRHPAQPVLKFYHAGVLRHGCFTTWVFYHAGVLPRRRFTTRLFRLLGLKFYHTGVLPSSDPLW